MENKFHKKIWIGISTPFQVNFFSSLMMRLADKVEFLVTARDHDRIIPMLDAKGIEYFKVGKHGGKDLDGKLLAYTDTIQELLPIVKKEKPDLLITERWPEAVRTAFGFNIPSWTLFYDEREYHVNWMTFPLSSKIFVPTFYSVEDLKGQGVTDSRRIVWFNGFHTCYLKGTKIDRSQNPFKDLGLKSPIVLVRPEPHFATFFVEERRKILEEAVSLLKKESNADIIVFPRDEQQGKRFPNNIVKIFDNIIFDCPVLYADVMLGAAETMLMESFVVGTPTVSAVYWKPAKPIMELHKYIPHFISPNELVKSAMSFFDIESNYKFREMAKTTVEGMDNPIDKIIEEIEKLYDFTPIQKVQRRSRIEILTDILRNISNQSLIFSHLLQKANVTHRELKADLELLLKNDLIERSVANNGGLYYKTTLKGMRTLQDYRRLIEVLGL